MTIKSKDKVVLVTGETSGIGLAVARKFGQNGAQVILAARNHKRGESAESELKREGISVRFVQTDVSDKEAVERLFQTIRDDFGRLDAACNGAALSEVIGKPLAEWSEDEYDHQMNSNLKGIWRCMKQEIKLMSASGGAIVNISSINGLGGAAGASLYSAAKHGVIGLTKSAAIEYAKFGIRINALCAGTFRTPLLAKVFESAKKEHPEQVEAMYTSLIPMGRIGAASEAADVIVWLCSEGSSYVTGHSMIADGGFTAMMR